MNKNLKKVISTVAALAISASSMVAFAANYPDVPETATYAQAVQELSALNVISGYEDGTFMPDKNVTRAEITKMIITSLGSATLNAANAAAGQDTKFADVPGSHWASGFVATATANATSNNGFIDGYSDTEFGPDDNVTFAQATKMLVSALGYKTYAENQGGWPNGYLSYGYTLEIADGVTGVSNDTQVTRAQVAQMIANAVKAPICVIEGYTTQWNGTQTPNLVVKDDLGEKVNSWQCLLNYSHDAYVVNGRVTATQAQGTVEVGKVKVDIETSNNYNGKQVVVSGANGGAVLNKFTEEAYIGETNADDYLFTYAEMVLQLNEDDEPTILSIAPIGAASKTVEFAAEDLVLGKSVFEKAGDVLGVLAVAKSATSTSVDKYELQAADEDKADADLYVNGVKVTTGTLAEKVEKYIANNQTGTVTLIDSPAAGSSSVDGVYDYVMVSYYDDVVVDYVVGDEEEAVIYFKEYTIDETSLVVDTTDETKTYSFTLTDGTELSALDLQENDVLTIAYDVTADNFGASNSYKALVSRDTVEGRIASANEEGGKVEYTINGEVYSVSPVSANELKVGYEYMFCLNAFGQIAYSEATAASTKLAILENVYSVENGEQWYAKVILPDATVETYPINKANAAAYEAKCKKVVDGETVKLDIQDRVIAYSVSSVTGVLTIKSETIKTKEAVDYEYSASANKIGSVKMDGTITSILDAVPYNEEEEDVVAMTADGLIDDNIYTAYGFNEVNGVYQLVIITEGTSGALGYQTEFVVYSKSQSKEIDGEPKDVYLVYSPDTAPEASAPVEVVLADDATVPANLVEGTPIVVEKNSAGYAKRVTALFQLDDNKDETTEVTLADGYTAFATAVRDGMKAGDLSAVLNEEGLKKLEYNLDERKDVADWVFGMVYERNGNDVKIATSEDFEGAYTVNVDKLMEYEVDSDAGVITYSYKLKANSGVRVANNVLSAVASMRADYAFTDEDKTIFDWNDADLNDKESDTYGKTSFILAKTIDDKIVEAYVIIPSPTRN